MTQVDGEVTYLIIVFPEPAINSGVVSDSQDSDDDELFTFSVNPKQRAGCFPVKGVPFGAPRGGTLEMSTGSSIVIERWIGGSQPFSQVLA